MAYQFTRRDMEAVAKELGYKGDIQGSVVQIDLLLEAWVDEVGTVPVNASELLETWLQNHGFQRAGTEDDSGEEEQMPTTVLSPPAEEETPPKPKPVPEPEPKPTPEPKPEAKPEPKPKPKAELKPKLKTEPKPSQSKAKAVPAKKEKPSPDAKAPKEPTGVRSLFRPKKKANPPKKAKASKAKRGRSLLPTPKASARRIVPRTLLPAQLCGDQELKQINLILAQYHSAQIASSSKGVRIRDLGPSDRKGGRDGREPIHWTEEELTVVGPLRTELKTLSLEGLIQRCKKTPLPPSQAKSIPGNPTLFDLLRTTRTDKATGQEVPCANSILRMRATVLLLRAAASQVSGRKVYY